MRGWRLAAVLLALGGCARLPEGPVSFRLQRFSSTEFYELAQDRGAVVLIDVWASWCGPCRGSMPHVAKLAARYAPRGLRFVTINIDKDTRGINRFLADVRLNPPVLLDERGRVTGELFGVEAWPTTLVIDRRGVVRFGHEGLRPDLYRALQVELEQLLAERP